MATPCARYAGQLERTPTDRVSFRRMCSDGLVSVKNPVQARPRRRRAMIEPAEAAQTPLCSDDKALFCRCFSVKRITNDEPRRRGSLCFISHGIAAREYPLGRSKCFFRNKSSMRSKARSRFSSSTASRGRLTIQPPWARFRSCGKIASIAARNTTLKWTTRCSSQAMARPSISTERRSPR